MNGSEVWTSHCLVCLSHVAQVATTEHIFNCPCRSSHLVWSWAGWFGGRAVPPPPTPLSHFIICSPAPGCSSISWPLLIHLLLLFSTDNWLEQWNACVPLPLKRYTLFIFQRSHFCSLRLSPSLSISLSPSLWPSSPCPPLSPLLPP